MHVPQQKIMVLGPLSVLRSLTQRTLQGLPSEQVRGGEKM